MSVGDYVRTKDGIIEKLVSENELLKKELTKERISNKSIKSVHFLQAIKPLITGEKNEENNNLNTNNEKDSEGLKNEDQKGKIIDKNKDKTEENINKKIESNNSSFFDEDFFSEKTSSNASDESIYDKYKALKEKYNQQKKKK